MKLSRIILIALLAAACGSSSDLEVNSVEPVGTYATGPFPITVHGSNFVPQLMAKQNGGGGVGIADGGVDSQFQVWLDDAAATQVSWTDQGTLTAGIPPMVPPGGVKSYDLKVVGPYGSGVKQKAFKISTQQPASLAASAVSSNGRTQVTTTETFDVALTIQNTGQSAANKVIPTIAPLGVAASDTPKDETANDVPTTGDGLGSINGGSSRVVTWHFSNLQPGTYPLVLSANGSDDVDAHTVGGAANISLRVVLPGELTTAVLPVSQTQISTGQQLGFDVDVTNPG
ncbi:MAG TPA: hypothetical protein VH083_25155, partial [Myxococcales bacterium]|nr:hypothetical protein [Myxococcales bacterium]